MNRERLTHYGLKWNPFAADLPVEGLLATPAIESLCRGIERQLVRQGGFAPVAGDHGNGKSVALRPLASRPGRAEGLAVAVLAHPSSSNGDFYREMADLFDITTLRSNIRAGFKALREHWRRHLDDTRMRPVPRAGEAREMAAKALTELRPLSSTEFDSRTIPSVVLAGDGRLLAKPRPGTPAGRVPDPPASRHDGVRCQGAGPDARPPARRGRQPRPHDRRPEGDARRARRRQPPGAGHHGRRPPPRRRRAGPRGARRQALSGDLGRMTGLPTRRPSELEDRPAERQWLVEGLWGRQAVGIVGGEPKCGKSFPALDIAVAVAAGVPCLRRFPAARPGPVLMFAAEDAGHIVRRRLQGIAAAAGADFWTPGIAVIDVPVLRLDHAADRRRPVETVGRHGPSLLVLDPLVRLHGVDENAVAGTAPILGFLRDVQRRSGTAVPLVHHARKSAASRPGQALRGSGEPHAWGDSNLYLRRRDGRTVMTAGHRAAPGIADVAAGLADDGGGPALRLAPARAAPTPEERVVRALAEAGAPLSRRQIRKRAATRNETVGTLLAKLVREGRVARDGSGAYRVAGA